LDLRMRRAGAGDAARLGTVRNISRRRAAARGVATTFTGFARIVAGATTGGCTAGARLGGVDGVDREAVPSGAPGLRRSALVMPNPRTASSATATATAPLRA
jgi:hypothetical protein